MFLRTDKHCCTNTVWLYVCPLRTMVFIAINNEWLTRDPFREYEIKKEETVRSFLTKDEIRLLMEGKLKNAKQELYRDLYLFCAFQYLAQPRFRVKHLPSQKYEGQHTVVAVFLQGASAHAEQFRHLAVRQVTLPVQRRTVTFRNADSHLEPLRISCTTEAIGSSSIVKHRCSRSS